MKRPSLPRAAFAVLAALAAVVTAVAVVMSNGTGGRGGGSTAGPHELPRSAAPAASGSWAGAWSTSPAAAEPNSGRGFAGRSLRNVVHTTLAGSRARITLSNLFGDRPLTIGHASLAVAAAGGPAAVPGSMRVLLFGGRPMVTIPAGRTAVSDPVHLAVGYGADLLVTTYSPTPSGPVTYHPHARQVSYLAQGDRTEDTGGAPYTARTPYWRYVSAVDVWSSDAQGAVVVLGDSITDGVSSTVGANRRWTDFLARRLRTEPGAPRYGVLNQGISGNRVLLGGVGASPRNNPSGLERFDRDVLSRTGVRAVVVELGVNDIMRRPRQTDPARITAGLRELVARAHARGLRVIGATLAPFGGRVGLGPEQERVRQGVNARIRAGDVFDGVVDFDVALRDPAAPQRLLPAYDCGDHLHPSDAGFRAMAQALDLGLLKGDRPAAQQL
ncbi:SGNH/GDSL hydrolase family protein [Streptomyces cinnamoneus]|uniref:SGNH hydrolase n=1 Tax=Streptomyces cinnamoneus TaxID=53446 RepID=A0A918TVB9_STRCJ|nr:SGNH/GDSL hydrolase family protein [Streptomyces cinnamoneus]GHC65099.1 SGNH hydrolase [Streptomyces cinnamoneus]